MLLLDSTTIPLCQKVFEWARFRRHKGTIELHMVLDYQGCIPRYACISEGRDHDAQDPNGYSKQDRLIILQGGLNRGQKTEPTLLKPNKYYYIQSLVQVNGE